MHPGIASGCCDQDHPDQIAISMAQNDKSQDASHEPSAQRPCSNAEAVLVARRSAAGS